MPARLSAERVNREADDGLLTCTQCGQTGPIDRALSVWRNGQYLAGICDPCSATHEIAIVPTPAGVNVISRRRAVIAL